MVGACFGPCRGLADTFCFILRVPSALQCYAGTLPLLPAWQDRARCWFCLNAHNRMAYWWTVTVCVALRAPAADLHCRPAGAGRALAAPGLCALPRHGPHSDVHVPGVAGATWNIPALTATTVVPRPYDFGSHVSGSSSRPCLVRLSSAETSRLLHASLTLCSCLLEVHTG